MIDRVSPSGFVAHSLRRVRRDFHLPAVWSLLAGLRALRREGLAAGLSELRFGWRSLRRGWRRASMTSELEPLRFAASEAPRVSIIVPVHNQWLHTFNCLRSILRSGSDTSYEIILVDNASTDRTGEVLDQLENVRVLRFDDNQGFLEGCNRGLEVARGEAVLFLNNDTVVTPGWLDSLIRVLDENPECGGVGPKLLFPNGRLQEAGSIVWRDAVASNYGKFDDPNRSQYNYLREVDYVSGAALLVRAELLAELGGLNESYSPGYWEDTDLCFALRRRGYKVLFQPASVVFHFEGTSSWGSYGRLHGANASTFRGLWSKELLEQPELGRESLFLASDRNPNAVVLVVAPLFESAGSEEQTEALLMGLREKGHRVVFWCENGSRQEARLEDLRQGGVEVLDELVGLDRFLRVSGRYVDAAVIDGSVATASALCDLQARIDCVVDAGSTDGSSGGNGGAGTNGSRPSASPDAGSRWVRGPWPNLEKEIRSLVDRLAHSQSAGRTT